MKSKISKIKESIIKKLVQVWYYSNKDSYDMINALKAAGLTSEEVAVALLLTEDN